MTTENFDIRDNTKWAIYNNWRDSNMTIPDVDTFQKSEIYPRTTPKQTHTQLTDLSLISRVADDWQSIEKNIEKIFDVLPSSSITSPSIDRDSILFTKDVLEFCSKHGILSECYKYHKFFVETFKNIQKITLSMIEDYELLDYPKLSFTLTILDSIENILKYEDVFKEKLNKEIDINKRQFFIYNYNLI